MRTKQYHCRISGFRNRSECAFTFNLRIGGPSDSHYHALLYASSLVVLLIGLHRHGRRCEVIERRKIEIKRVLLALPHIALSYPVSIQCKIKLVNRYINRYMVGQNLWMYGSPSLLAFENGLLYSILIRPLKMLTYSLLAYLHISLWTRKSASKLE